MTAKEIKSVIEGNTFSSSILFHAGHFVAFGRDPNDDFVVVGSATTIKKSSIYSNGKDSKSDESHCEELFKAVVDLYDDSTVCHFYLNSYQIKFIQKTIAIYDATHIVLYSDEEGIFVNFYDIRKCVPQGRMSRSHETRLLVHKLSSLQRNHFKVTLNAGSFKMVPPLDLDVAIGTNKICTLTHDDSGYMYLLRDQELVQPVIEFFSDRLKTKISLSFVPTSNVPVQDTNPQMTPDFE